MKARLYLRVPLPLPVRIKVIERDNDYHPTRIDDISWGGVFVVMDPPAEVSSQVVIHFALADESVSLELWGKVVRKVKASGTRPAGMGVQFEPLDEDSRSLIQRLVEDGIKALINPAG